MTAMVWMESQDEVEIGTEPVEIFETTDFQGMHSAHPFTVAIFATDDLDAIELGTEPFVIL